MSTKPKVYVSARAKTRLKEVREIQNHLRETGYDVTSDWTDASIARPYRDTKNRLRNLTAQERMLRSAADVDIFILIDDEGLRGAYVELGAFLYDCLGSSRGRQAYIVGKDSHKREHIFESPDYVKYCDTIDDVYQDLKIAA